MESLFIMWSDILLHNHVIDESIYRFFIDRIRENISQCDADTLEYQFKKLPVNYRDDVSGVFRDHALFLLESPNRRWTKEKINAIKKLLNNDGIGWSKEQFIQLLEFISQSNTLELLDIFPEILDDWFRSDFSDTKEKKIPKICITWFKNLLFKLDVGTSNTSNRKSSNESNFIFSIFQQLELMYPLLGQRINIWRDLTEIAIERVKGCSEAQIFTATKLIVKIKQDEVKKLFLDMVKEILNKTVQQTNDQLLNKISIICGGHTKPLEVPNP